MLDEDDIRLHDNSNIDEEIDQFQSETESPTKTTCDNKRTTTSKIISFNDAFTLPDSVLNGVTTEDVDLECNLNDSNYFKGLSNWVSACLQPPWARFHDESIVSDRNARKTTTSFTSHEIKCLWKINFTEASIYLEEGRNNTDFSSHPKGSSQISTYMFVNSFYFRIVELILSISLLSLVFFETCFDLDHEFDKKSESSNSTKFDSISTNNFENVRCNSLLYYRIVAIFECCILIFITIQSLIKLHCFNPLNLKLKLNFSLKHQRTQFKFIILVMLLIDSFVSIFMPISHKRLTRCLRPIFFVDNHFCGGVRRFMRQIFLSLPPVLDMLTLVMFVMTIYSVFAFYIFGTVDSTNFGTLQSSFVSMFILLTTANFPDVMMSCYAYNSYSVLFFVSYLLLNLYFLMNLMSAAVYDAFIGIEREKFRKLFMHRREAIHEAFAVLSTKNSGLTLAQFEGVARSYMNVNCPVKCFLLFKYLNRHTKSGILSLNDLLFDDGMYTAPQIKWISEDSRLSRDWFEDKHQLVMGEKHRIFLSTLKRFVSSKYFEIGTSVVVSLNALTLIIQTASMSSPNSDDITSTGVHWVSYTFVGIYLIEISLKLLAYGFTQFFAKQFNIFDFVVTGCALLSVLLQILNIHLFYIVLLRPIRLLGLFKTKRRFRDVFATAIILLPRLLSATFVILLIYYVFAIIGIEFMGSISLVNCCKGTTIEPFFVYNTSQSFLNQSNSLYYYLNNFKDTSSAFVTLFELTVINNWFVVMEAYVIQSMGDGTFFVRLYFMTFYLLTMIVMTIIVAFILEAFLFKNQFSEFIDKHEELNKLSATVKLEKDEIEYLMERNMTEGNHFKVCSLLKNVKNDNLKSLTFEGVYDTNKERLQMLMYSEQIETWIAQDRKDKTVAKSKYVLQASSTS